MNEEKELTKAGKAVQTIITLIQYLGLLYLIYGVIFLTFHADVVIEEILGNKWSAGLIFGLSGVGMLLSNWIYSIELNKSEKIEKTQIITILQVITLLKFKFSSFIVLNEYIDNLLKFLLIGLIMFVFIISCYDNREKKYTNLRLMILTWIITFSAMTYSLLGNLYY